eukprot:12107771-Prorocentrum_lima.AAC.1
MDRCSHETSAGSGEAQFVESSGDHQEDGTDEGFFDVKNDSKLPPGTVPYPGFFDVKNDFKLPPGILPET